MRVSVCVCECVSVSVCVCVINEAAGSDHHSSGVISSV